jgi:hypothetical protein
MTSFVFHGGSPIAEFLLGLRRISTNQPDSLSALFTDEKRRRKLCGVV